MILCCHLRNMIAVIRDDDLVEGSKGQRAKGKDDHEKEKHSLDNVYNHLVEGHMERIKVDL